MFSLFILRVSSSFIKLANSLFFLVFSFGFPNFCSIFSPFKANQKRQIGFSLSGCRLISLYILFSFGLPLCTWTPFGRENGLIDRLGRISFPQFALPRPSALIVLYCQRQCPLFSVRFQSLCLHYRFIKVINCD